MDEGNKVQTLEKKVLSLQESVTKLSKQLGREASLRKKEETKSQTLRQELEDQKAKNESLQKEQSKIIEEQQQQIIQQQSIIASLKHTIQRLESTNGSDISLPPSSPPSSVSSSLSPSGPAQTTTDSISSWKVENETLLKSLYSAINSLTHDNINLTNELEALKKRTSQQQQQQHRHHLHPDSSPLSPLGSPDENNLEDFSSSSSSSSRPSPSDPLPIPLSASSNPDAL